MDSALTITKGRLAKTPSLDFAIVKPLYPLTQSEQKIVSAKSEGVMLKEMNDKELILMAVLLMDRAKIRLNHKTDYVDASEMQLMIAKDLKAFPGLTDAEIWNAFTMGLNGEFLKEKDKDPVITFSATNLVRWIKAYLESVKAPVMKKVAQAEHQVNEKPVPSISEQNAMLLKGLYAHFEKMKADSSYTFSDYGNVYHSFLSEIGIKLATRERRWKIYEEETQLMKLRLSEIQSKMAKKAWLEAIDQLELNSAKEARQLPGNEVEMQVIIACKKRVLLEWLRECLEFSIEPSELIDEKLSNL